MPLLEITKEVIKNYQEDRFLLKNHSEYSIVMDLMNKHSVKLLEDLVDTYICSNPSCSHLYRNFYQDISEFHEIDYRKDGINMGSVIKQKTRLIRHQRQLQLLQNFIKPQQTCLDVASGKGFALLVFKEYFNKVTGVDIDLKVVEHNKKINPEIEVLHNSFMKIDENKSFDVIIASDVLEHIEETNNFVEHAHKIVNDHVVIQVPIERPLIPPNYDLITNKKPHHQKFDGHLHYFTKNSLTNLFTKNNLFKLSFYYETVPGEVAGAKEALAVYTKL